MTHRRTLPHQLQPQRRRGRGDVPRLVSTSRGAVRYMIQPSVVPAPNSPPFPLKVR